MKALSTIAILSAFAALAACANVAPNDPPAQVISPAQYGGLKYTALGGVPVTSGNYAAIPPGQPGDGGSPGL